MEIIYRIKYANLDAKQKEIVCVSNGHCNLVGPNILNLNIDGLNTKEITRKYRNINFIFLVEIGTFYKN